MKENVAGKDENGNFVKYLKETFECEYEVIEDEMEVVDEIIDFKQGETYTPESPGDKAMFSSGDH